MPGVNDAPYPMLPSARISSRTGNTVPGGEYRFSEALSPITRPPIIIQRLSPIFFCNILRVSSERFSSGLMLFPFVFSASLRRLFSGREPLSSRRRKRLSAVSPRHQPLPVPGSAGSSGAFFSRFLSPLRPTFPAPPTFFSVHDNVGFIQPDHRPVE